MKILISGICGFVGSTVARSLLDAEPGITVVGIDNLSRPGSQTNIEPLRALGVKIVHGDVRLASDLESIAGIDWIIDAAANASVLAGVDGATTSRQLLENNLYGTVNLLELAKRCSAGFILLSTSRVYSAAELATLPVHAVAEGYRLDETTALPPGVTPRGVSESFSTTPPLSLYGSSKLASEFLALEYHHAFGMPVWINRCGVLAGAGQFGRADQGIFAYWINGYLRRAPLRYIGFDGRGYQTRDCLHPRDLVPLLRAQMHEPSPSNKARVINVAGGAANAMSLAQLSDWCGRRFGAHTIESGTAPRQFDVPWLLLDSTLAERSWSWRSATNLESILSEIAAHAEAHPDWLQLSAAL